MFNASNVTDMNSITMSAPDGLPDGMLVIPANRLDADQYSVDDIDGVTESIFGSGNMAYASLQATQTDAMIALNEAAFSETDPGLITADNSFAYGAGAVSDANSTLQMSQLAGHVIPTDTDRDLGAADVSGTETLSAEGSFTNTTVGALGASALSGDAGSFSPSFSMTGAGDTVRDGGASVSNVVNNVSDTIQNVVNTVNETIENVTNLAGDVIDNITNLGDETIDTVINLGDQTIDSITNLANNVVENILEGDVQEVITNIIDSITNDVNAITEIVGSEITEVTQIITGTVGDLTDGLLGKGGLGLHLDGGVLETVGANIDISVDGGIAGSIGTELVSENLSAITEDLTGLSLPAVSDIGAEIGFDLLGGADPDDGADISLAGVELSGVSLDAIENIVGDVDINVDVPVDLSDPGGLLDDVLGMVQDIVEDLGNLDLADAGEILDILGGQGVAGTLGILAGDTETEQDFGADIDSLINDPLGAGEDLNIDDAINLLSGSGENPISALAGDLTGGDTNWTESTIGGGLFDDLTGLVGGAAGGDILPDPSGTVAEGLGALHIDPPGTGLGLGGLGGLLG